MRIDRRFLQWGVFLIVFGAVPLGVQLGWLDRSAFGGVWRLWPVLLIAIGLGILFGRGRLELPFRLLPPIAFGLLFGAGLAGGLGSIGCAGADQRASAFPSTSGAFGSRAEIQVTVDCGTAAVTSLPGSSWTFSGTGDSSRLPSVDSSLDSLTVHAGQVDFLDFGAARSDWHLQLPSDPSLDLSLDMNAGDAHLDLAGANLAGLSLTANAGSASVNLAGAVAVGSLDATINAGDVRITLPQRSVDGSITVNAGHLGLCQPPGIALRIESKGALSLIHI